MYNSILCEYCFEQSHDTYDLCGCCHYDIFMAPMILKTDYFHYAGKLKNKKVKNDKLQTTEAPQDEKTETVDQIKKKYGYTTTSSVSIHLLTYSAYKEMIDFWNHFGSLFWTWSTMHSSVIPFGVSPRKWF